MQKVARLEPPESVGDDGAGHLAPRIDVRRFAALGGLELWSMYNWFREGCYSAPMLWISAPSSPSVHTMSIRVDGAVQSCGAAGTMMAAASDICVVQRITGQLPQHDECTFFSLAIPAHLFDPEQQLVYARHFRTRVTDEVRPAEVLRRLSHALTSHTASGVHCEELLSELLAVALPRRTREERSCSVSIKKARDFIDAYWNEPFSLEDLARAVGLTKWHLTRSFAASLGVRPSEYARTVRARHALAELQRGVPLARVALVTGYADQAHMNRELRRIFGFTPGSYRNASAEGPRGGEGSGEPMPATAESHMRARLSIPGPLTPK